MTATPSGNPVTAGESAPAEADSRSEVERLQEENAALRRQLAGAAAVPSERAARDSGVWRTVVATFLIVLSCLLAPFAVIAVWAKSEVTDTDRYVATVAPLAQDPAVQAAVATAATDAIVAELNVDQLVGDVLADFAASGVLPRLTQRLQTLEVPISRGIQGFIADEVSNIVASPQFAQLWTEVNRATHDQLLAALSGRAENLTITGGTVTLDVGPIIAQVKQNLVDRGFGLAENIPVINKTIVLLESDKLARVQNAYRLVDLLGLWLPIITLGLAALGVYVARDHRRAIIGFGLGLAASMLLLGLGLAFLRTAYLAEVSPALLPADAASSVFDSVVAFLRNSLRTVGVVGLLVGLGAFLAGSSRTAVTVRGVWTQAFSRLRSAIQSAGLDLGAVGEWTYRSRTWLRAAACVLALVTLVVWNYPTPSVVLGVLAVLLLVLAVIEVLAAPPDAETERGGAVPAT